jgi:hypothetical protein
MQTRHVSSLKGQMSRTISTKAKTGPQFKRLIPLTIYRKVEVTETTNDGRCANLHHFFQSWG